MTYLEKLFVENPGAKHRDAIRADGSVVASEESFGDLLLAVDNDGDRLLLHADGHAVPPFWGQKRWL